MSRRLVISIIGGICSLIIAMGVSRFAYTPILPIMKESIGFSEETAGYLASSNYVGYLVGALLAGMVNWRMKKKFYLKMILILNIISVGLMGLTIDYVSWFLLRFASGVTSGLIFVLSSSIILDLLATKGRSTWTGFFYSGVGIGIFITGIVVPLLDSFYSWKGVWIGLAILSAVLGVVVWAWLKQKDNYEKQIEISKTNPVETKIASKMLPWLTIAYGLEGLGYIVTGTFLVDIVVDIPSLAEFASLSWIFVGIAAIPSTLLWGIFAKRKGYIPAIVLAFLLQAIGVILPVVFFNSWGALLGAFLFGATFMGITTLATTYARQLQPENSSRVIGILTTVYGIGQIIGPAGAGMLVTITGQYSIALFLAAGVLLVAILVLLGGQWYITIQTKRKEDVSCLM